MEMLFCRHQVIFMPIGCKILITYDLHQNLLEQLAKTTDDLTINRLHSNELY